MHIPSMLPFGSPSIYFGEQPLYLTEGEDGDFGGL